MSKALSPLAVMAPTFTIRGTRAEISTGALRNNLAVIAARAEGCEVCAVVKANGYGLGGELVAGVLAAAGVRRFGVATVEEGLALRAGGVHGTILILGGATWVRAPALLVEAALTPVLASVDEVLLLEEHLARRGSSEVYPVHLAIDTGMGREGFHGGDDPSEACAEMAAALRAAPHLKAVGAMTHFANADLADPAFTDQQIERFALGLRALRKERVPLEVAHIANSAAVLSIGGRPGPLASEAFDDLEWWVRPGLALTGATPFPDGRAAEQLDLAVRWVASIVAVKQVPPGTPISYGSTFVTQRESQVAVLGLGYADGMHRRVSNEGASVLVGGHRAPILGRVCMDLCVIDLTDLPEALRRRAGLGAEVVVLGSGGEDQIGAWEVAEQGGTIAYEVLTSIAARVPRVPVS